MSYYYLILEGFTEEDMRKRDGGYGILKSLTKLREDDYNSIQWNLSLAIGKRKGKQCSRFGGPAMVKNKNNHMFCCKRFYTKSGRILLLDFF